MISRRPKRGEAIERMANWSEHINDGAEPVWEPRGTVHRTVRNLCWLIRHGQKEPGDDDVFVWRFPDTNNMSHRIVEKP